MLRKATASVLLLALAGFSLGQAVEILHPLEEEQHDEHPQLAGTNITAPLPCDEGTHAHRHSCLHCQQLTVGTRFDLTTASAAVQRQSIGQLPEPARRIIVQYLRRGPPSC